MNSAYEEIQNYYGKILKNNQDLKTSACCDAEKLPPSLGKIVSQIHPEVRERFFGCGSPIPPLLSGLTVLDLGCGSGRDAFLLSKLVGAKGKVIGVDMTAKQIDVARQFEDYHQNQFCLPVKNTQFLKGYLENLEELGIQNESVDLVVSNCVLNLSPDKERAFGEIFRVLKPGGELYFSDVFSDRRVPTALSEDPVILGECLGGALYTEDFRRLLGKLGILDFRVVKKSPIAIHQPEIEEKVGGIRFSSLTLRAFKLDVEDRCEDYGQVAYYQGTIPGHPHAFVLDDHHRLEKNRPFPICDNTAAFLTRTRYAPHFRVEGDKTTHFGLFDCRLEEIQAESSGSCC